MKKLTLVLALCVIAGALLFGDDAAAAGNTAKAAAEKVFMGFSMWGLIWGLIFNSVGVFAFMYGKRKSNAAFIAIGILLTGYSWVVQDTTLTFIIGAVLTGALFLFKKS